MDEEIESLVRPLLDEVSRRSSSSSSESEFDSLSESSELSSLPELK
jgi:hypothetical protein